MKIFWQFRHDMKELTVKLGVKLLRIPSFGLRHVAAAALPAPQGLSTLYTSEVVLMIRGEQSN